MTAITPGSEQLYFHSKDEIAAHLLKRVLANQNHFVGTEVEMFLVDGDGNPITRENGQKLFSALSKEFSNDYSPMLNCETMDGGWSKASSLDIPGLGAINLEAGHQIEFAGEPNQFCTEIAKRNKVAFDAIATVANAMGYKIIFEGHLDDYAARTEGVFRSRGWRWRKFYDAAFDADDARILREVQEGTASTQFTLDSCGEKFHEAWSALLILEPVLALHYNKRGSDRLNKIHNDYRNFLPIQVEPVIEAWKAENPAQTIGFIVDRLMKLPVPFLPNARPGVYKAEPLNFDGRPATVNDLMLAGRLTEKFLNNVGGFFYTGPAFRNYRQGLIEVRYLDSIGSPQEIASIAKFIKHMVYDDSARQELLDQYSVLTPDNIKFLHWAAAMRDRRSALNANVAGQRIGDIVDKVMEMGHSACIEVSPTADVKQNDHIVGARAHGRRDNVLEPAASYHRLPSIELFGRQEALRPDRHRYQRPGFARPDVAA